jgi:hypothetical protein
MSTDRDQHLYETLGLQPDASLHELKYAYRSLAKRLHPDKNSDTTKTASERFQRLNAAYEQLTAIITATGAATVTSTGATAVSTASAVVDVTLFAANAFVGIADVDMTPPRRMHVAAQQFTTLSSPSDDVDSSGVQARSFNSRFVTSPTGAVVAPTTRAINRLCLLNVTLEELYVRSLLLSSCVHSRCAYSHAVGLATTGPGDAEAEVQRMHAHATLAAASAGVAQPHDDDGVCAVQRRSHNVVASTRSLSNFVFEVQRRRCFER